MITKYISSKVIVSRIYDNYNIQSDDFISRIATWTYNAIREIGIKQTYILQSIIQDFTLGKYQLPIDIDRVYGVNVNGHKIDYDFSNKSRTVINNSTKQNVISFNGDVYNTEDNLMDINSISPSPTTNITSTDVFGIRTWKDKQQHPSNPLSRLTNVTYKISNGWIHFNNINEGYVEVLCGQIPYEQDIDFDIKFPIIPDDEALIECITQYCLKNILMRGYHHPVLNLTANNPFINPAMAYKNGQIAARNSCNAISADARATLSKMLQLNVI